MKSFRVADSLDTKMDISNLARVFGPTIVGHALSNPDPMTILQDTKRQPKVGPNDLVWLFYIMFLWFLVTKFPLCTKPSSYSLGLFIPG